MFRKKLEVYCKMEKNVLNKRKESNVYFQQIDYSLYIVLIYINV